MRSTSVVAEPAHQLERPGLEAEREAAAELEVFARSDVSIENVAGLRDQDAEQPIADRRRGSASTGTDLPGAVVRQVSTERNTGAGR